MTQIATDTTVSPSSQALSKDLEVEQVKQVELEQVEAEQAPEKPRKKRDKKTVLRVIIALVIITVGIFLILFLVAKAARFDSVGSMLEHMGTELSVMWQRIIA